MPYAAYVTASGETVVIDSDNDGYNLDEDCDDNDPAVNTGAVEINGNNIDENCDGKLCADETTSVFTIAEARIRFFPNPVATVLNIEVKGSLDYVLSVYNLEGKLMLKEKNINSVGIQNFSDSIYLLEIEDLTTASKVMEKIVVSKIR